MIDVSAIDKDSGPNAQISYTFSPKTRVRFVKCFWVYVQLLSLADWFSDLFQLASLVYNLVDRLIDCN